MKKIALHLIWITAFFQFACTAGRMAPPAPIGILPLTSYSATNQASQNDTSFAVYKNEASFTAAFSTSSSAARKPEFYGQLAVAVSLNAPASLYFEKAMKGGNKIFAYLKSCEAASQPACQTARYFLATVPKVGDAKSIEFIINDETKGRVDL